LRRAVGQNLVFAFFKNFDLFTFNLKQSHSSHALRAVFLQFVFYAARQVSLCNLDTKLCFIVPEQGVEYSENINAC
jgi:hypothetical protein